MNFDDLHNPQSEAGVISTLIHNPSFIFHSEQLSPRDFYSKTDDVPVNACLYWAIKEIVNSGVYEIDDFILTNTLLSNKSIEARMNKVNINTVKDILDLSKFACRNTVEEYKSLVKDIQDFAARRELYLSCQKLLYSCLNENCTSEELKKMTYDIAEKSNLSMSKNKEIKSFAQKLDFLYGEIEARQNGQIKCLEFPYPTLSKYVQLEPGELVIFGANAKIGKSACLLTCIVSLLRQGNCILLMDSELSDRLFTLRIISHISGVDFALVKSGIMSEEQKQRVHLAKEEVKTFKFYHEYLPMFNDNDLITLFKRVNAIDKVDLLVVDYFKITQFGDAFSTSLQLAKSVDIVKNEIAGVYDIPALSAIQLTKNGEVALSAAVIRNCSTLVSITRKSPEEIQKDGGVSYGNSKFFVGINRNGEQHSEGEYISVDFMGNTLTYKEPSEQPEKKLPY